MTHDEAIKDGATERYVLDEMTDEERDAFEEHYFECAVCAEDVRTAISLREGLAAEQRRESIPNVVPIEPRQRRLPASIAAAAAATIAVVSMYAGVVQPKQRQLAEALKPSSPVATFFSDLRSEEKRTVVDRNHPHLFLIRIDPSYEVPVYKWTIVDTRGNAVAANDVAADQLTDLSLPIMLAARSLEPGNYTLRVISKRAEEHSFTVR